MSDKMTITEALAEVRVIDKRIRSKQAFINDHITRPKDRVDPLADDGGELVMIQREQQAIHDLQERLIRIRAAIAGANADNKITVQDTTRSIADWLVWRREVADRQINFLQGISNRIGKSREVMIEQTTRRPRAAWEESQVKISSPEIVVNVDESELAKEIEELQAITETLDGQLSLKNATIVIEF